MSTQGQDVAAAIDRAADKIAVSITGLAIAVNHLATARSGVRPVAISDDPTWPHRTPGRHS